MEMIEIDPKLFVTCRLCLDNLGVYQIVPSVQQQIKYCYDIEVDPFDRLPQLICKSCESTLSKYSEIKNNYVNKQNTLREKLEIKAVTLTSAPEPEPITEDTVTSTQQFTSEEKVEKENSEVIICDASSIKSSDKETSSITKCTFVIADVCNKKPSKRIKRPLPDSWETEYDKWFMCRLCNKCCKTRCGMIKHINSHPSLLHKYHKFIDKDCSVKLKKADNRPNLCNSEQIVVHNMDKFIRSDANFYYTLFKQKRILDNNKDEVNSFIETISVPNTDKSPQSSDSEPVFKRNKWKRLRLISGSSNETLVLENDIKKDSNFDTKKTSKANTLTNDNECINLDDSSDTASCKSDSNTVSVNKRLNKNSFTLSKQMDTKIIQNIISVCYKRYVERLDCNENDDATRNCTKKIDSSLKHKVLSFGRKIINNSGINCVGILRYLERHNLEIAWIPRHLSQSNKKPDHVQVMIKLKSSAENDALDCGWTVLQDLKNPIGSTTINLSEVTCVHDQTLKENPDAHSSVDMPVSNEDKREEKNDPDISEQATLCPTNTISEKDLLLKKLLNANPVQNPKQLRKKPNALEIHSASIKKTKEQDKPIENPELSVSSKETVIETSDNVSQMPVITSTISLAPVTTADDVNEQNNINGENVGMFLDNTTISNINTNGSNLNDERGSVNDSQVSVNSTQWIKVKPVTELMSDRALNTMNQQNVQKSNIAMNQSLSINLPYQNSSNIVFMTNVAVPQVHNIINTNQLSRPSELLPMQENNMLAQDTLDREFVLMDTVDLPHRKTDSPFRYFKMLLQIHNITLSEANEAIPIDSHNLIKFKLLFQQEANIPVVLCLSLYCTKQPNSAARFCIKVKDAKHKDIDITRLSPHWQWEILKVYGGDVVMKMMQNARKAGQIIHDYTKIFVCLLRGINFQKLS